MNEPPTKRPARERHVRDLVRALPKAHLHVHLEGAIRWTTVTEFAKEHDTVLPGRPPYRDFRDFADAYQALRSVVGSNGSLTRIAREYVEDAAADGVVWSDVHFAPLMYADRFGPPEAVLEAVLEGFSEASTPTTGASVIVAVNPHAGLHAANKSVELAIRYRGEGVSGLGYVGFEEERDTEAFSEVFAAARAAGVAIFPHAGEVAGSWSVAESIDWLSPTRICHGTRAWEDDAVLERLRELDICLDMSVTSNVVLNVVPSADVHPLSLYLDAGIPVTLNADDPGMFGVTLTDEYLLAHEALKVPLTVLWNIAKTSLERSAASDDVRAAALSALEHMFGEVPTGEFPFEGPAVFL